MSLTESQSAFEQRCNAVRPGLFEQLAAEDINTFSKLAFAVGTPQTPPTASELQTLGSKLNEGRDPTLGFVSDLKRLIFEASTFVLAELKQQVSAPDPSEPSKKLPFVEKQSRLAEQQTRLTGMKLEGELAPAHSLIDAAYNIAETGAIIYLPPTKCGSRDQEVLAEAKSKSILRIENQQISIASSSPDLQVDIGTELKCLWACRGAALLSTKLGFSRGMSMRHGCENSWSVSQRRSPTILSKCRCSRSSGLTGSSSSSWLGRYMVL